MSLAQFSIGTTTHRINLIDPRGFHCGNWEPQAGSAETTFSESALANYRQPIHYREATTIETIPLTLRRTSQDSAIRSTQDLRRMLRDAMDYFASAHQSEPVYLTARAACETNPRYALVLTGTLPADDNPFREPFLSSSAMGNLTLVVERGPWTDVVPGTGTCIPACGYDEYCPIWHLEFDPDNPYGDPQYVDIGSPAVLDNLPSGANGFTVEAWIRADAAPANEMMIARKDSTTTGWRFYIHTTQGLGGFVDCLTTEAESRSGSDEFQCDGKWHHVVMTYDDLGARTVYLAIDGHWVQTYFLQNAGVGAYQADAADTLYISDSQYPQFTFDGGIGWVRIWNTQPYTPGTDFLPDQRCEIPTYPANVVWAGIWEGYGTTAHDLTANFNDGTIHDAEWDCECNRIRGRSCAEAPIYGLQFDPYDYVNCRSNAQLDNLPAADFTVDFWMRSYFSGYSGMIACKCNVVGANTGWYIFEYATGELAFYLDYGGQDAIATVAAGDWPVGEYCHVAAVWDQANLTGTLYINGQDVTTFQQVGIGAYTGDAADNFMLGIANDFTSGPWSGELGWVRVSNNQRWVANFTPPTYCALPTVDANTLALWIWEGYGNRTYSLDPVGGVSPAILVGPEWFPLCEETEETSCDSPVFFANKRNEAQLTHIFVYDASGPAWSVNLLDLAAPPYELLPTVPAGGDIVYFGVRTNAGSIGPSGYDLRDAGPFCSLVFDTETAADDIPNYQWQYWNGAWAALTVQDNTNTDGAIPVGHPFDTTGIKSVHWIQPADWVPNAVTPGVGATPVRAYWVRLLIQAPVAAAPSAPVQQHRHPYTITWPFVEVEDDNALGDIDSWVRYKIRNQSDRSLSIPRLPSDRLIMGLRSMDRGDAFTAYINIADEQNPPGVTVAAMGVGPAFVTTMSSPTGRALQVNPAGLATCGLISLGPRYVEHTHGEFHVYLRATQTVGTPGDCYFTVDMSTNAGYTGDIMEAKTFYFVNNNDHQLFDLGRVTLPTTMASADIYYVYIRLRAAGTGGGPIYGEVMEFYDIIFIPTDEWAMDTADPSKGDGAIIGSRDFTKQYLDIDPLSQPREWATMIKDGIINRILQYWRRVPNTKPLLHPNTTQRLWILSSRYQSSTDERSEPCVAFTGEVYNQAHYLSMRGDR